MVLLSLTVLTIGGKDLPVFGSVRGAAVDLVAGLSESTRGITKPVRSWWGGATEYDDLLADNKRLQDEVDVLRSKQIRNQTAAADLQRLQEQLNIPFVSDIPSVIAQVTTGPYSNFDSNTLQVNRGSKDGVKKGMTVVTNAGLVGMILEVTNENSIVRLITDYDFVVGIKIASDGNYTTGHGTGPESPFLIDDGIEITAKVAKGDAVVTSGLESSAFPAGIPVGIIDKVEQSQAQQTQVVEVKLAVDLVRLNVVSILLRERPA
ncbi:MAG: rod shape-determining protein MreC [Microthrixaceae bacterium]